MIEVKKKKKQRKKKKTKNGCWRKKMNYWMREDKKMEGIENFLKIRVNQAEGNF